MGEGSLSQEDIDALLTGGGGDAAAGGGGASGSDFNLSGELDSLLGGGGSGGGDALGGGADSPSFADISAALGPSAPPTSAPRSPNRQASPSQSTNLNLLMDVNLALTVELGRTNMYIKDVNGLNEGTVVELDKNVGEDLDILANGRLVGRGKLVAMDDFYGIQITEIVDQSRRL